jgi:lysophospholipase L1-like esterase
MVAGLVVAGCASPAVVQAPPTSLPPQAGCAAAATPNSLCIVILGDSIAVGVPVPTDGPWWVRLRQLLQTALPDRMIAIDNWAVSGSQVDVLESAARDQPAVGTYDLAIVIEGVNDEHALPVDAWRQRYEAAVSGLETQGVTVILTTPPPSFEGGTFGPRFDATAAAVRDVAGSKRPLFDLAARWHSDGPTLAATYYVDYVHQSTPGQVLMAAIARDVVLKAIGGVGQR